MLYPRESFLWAFAADKTRLGLPPLLPALVWPPPASLLPIPPAVALSLRSLLQTPQHLHGRCLLLVPWSARHTLNLEVTGGVNGGSPAVTERVYLLAVT